MTYANQLHCEFASLLPVLVACNGHSVGNVSMTDSCIVFHCLHACTHVSDSVIQCSYIRVYICGLPIHALCSLSTLLKRST